MRFYYNVYVLQPRKGNREENYRKTIIPLKVISLLNFEQFQTIVPPRYLPIVSTNHLMPLKQSRCFEPEFWTSDDNQKYSTYIFLTYTQRELVYRYVKGRTLGDAGPSRVFNPMAASFLTR